MLVRVLLLVVVVLFGVVVMVVVVILKPDCLDPVGRHHADAAKARRLDQPVQPAFECKTVEHEDIGLTHGARIGRGRVIDMGIAVGPDQRGDGNPVAADALDHVSQYRKGGDHRDGSVGGPCRRWGGQRQADEGGCGYQQVSASGHCGVLSGIDTMAKEWCGKAAHRPEHQRHPVDDACHEDDRWS